MVLIPNFILFMIKLVSNFMALSKTSMVYVFFLMGFVFVFLVWF
jgi:hypothetical protein